MCKCSLQIDFWAHSYEPFHICTPLCSVIWQIKHTNSPGNVTLWVQFHVEFRQKVWTLVTFKNEPCQSEVRWIETFFLYSLSFITWIFGAKPLFLLKWLWYLVHSFNLIALIASINFKPNNASLWHQSFLQQMSLCKNVFRSVPGVLHLNSQRPLVTLCYLH